MNNQPIKASAESYNTQLFYLIQINGEEKRYVVSLREKLRIRMIMTGFINQIENKVQVKIRDLDKPEEPVDFYGLVEKSLLHHLMTKHEAVIFHNGNHELMLRNPKTQDYVVFDEHGLIFIYTKDDYADYLKKLDVKYKPNEKLIYEFDHVHYCLPNGQEKLTAFIEDLGLVTA